MFDKNTVQLLGNIENPLEINDHEIKARTVSMDRVQPVKIEMNLNPCKMSMDKQKSSKQVEGMLKKSGIIIIYHGI